MDYQAGEITILNNNEFVMLLAAAGIDEWYGIDLSGAGTDPEDEKKFNEILAALYQKHIISWGENKAHIDDRFKPMMRVLKDASGCVTAVTVQRPGYVKGSYISHSNVVIIERRTASSDELEISMLPFKWWVNELEAEGYCPQVMSPSDDSLTSDSGETLISEFELRALPEGSLEKTIRLYECGLYGILEQDDGIRRERMPFSSDRLADILKDWAGGEI